MWTNLIKQRPAAKATIDLKVLAVFSQRSATRLKRLAHEFIQARPSSLHHANASPAYYLKKSFGDPAVGKQPQMKRLLLNIALEPVSKGRVPLRKE